MCYKAQLQSTKKENLRINEYWAKCKNIADNLEVANEVILKTNLIYYILGGLGPKFDMVFENIISRIEDLTFVKVYTRLLTCKSKLEDYNTYLIINIGGNNVNSSSCANNVVCSFNPINSNGINVNLSTGDFGDLNSSNASFVEKKHQWV